MPYNKDKQQAYQAAEQQYIQAEEAARAIERNDEDFGHQLKRAKQEIQEAEQVIKKAYINASERQREELNDYKDELEELKGSLQQFE